MVSTDKISPNKSQEIFVDKCDHGDFIFNVNTNGPPDWSNRWSKYVREDCSNPCENILFYF